MSTWYRVTGFSRTPEPVEVERETEHFITIKGSRSRDKKIADYISYYPTLEEAETAIAARVAKDAEQERHRRIRGAAPDMYEALRAAKTHLVSYGYGAEAQALLGRINDALRKAEGDEA